jgi:tRNA(Arg) A34 adenosine deaminase TadA
MQKAVDLAQYSINNFKGPFGAIIVKEGNIVGSSGNFSCSDLDPGAHAEVIAIRDACHNLKSLDLSGCQIYSSSEPCPMCMAVIYWAQISEVYFCNAGLQNHHVNTNNKPKHHCLINSVIIPTSKVVKVLERDKMNQKQQNIFIA